MDLTNVSTLLRISLVQLDCSIMKCRYRGGGGGGGRGLEGGG